MRNTPIWKDTISMPVFFPLTNNKKVDVCIVGGGIAGLTTAYLLTKEGKRVCVLEDSVLGKGQTGRTTAHFSTALDRRYFEIEKLHGIKGARLAAESHATAIEKVIRIIKAEKIDCEMEIVDGFLFAAGDERDNVIQDELKAAARVGLKDVNFRYRSPMTFFDTGACLHFPRQLELNPLKYLSALSDRIENAGGIIFTNTHVNYVQGGKNAEVRTKEGFSVYCKSIVIATNSPVNDIFAIHTKQAPYRTYVLGLRIPKDSVPNALFWDTLKPYHYLSLKRDFKDYDVLIVGGEDHKTGQDDNPEERFEVLEKWARERFPNAGEVLYHWSGQVMQSVDGLGFLGHNPMDRDNVYVITGDSGNGMTNSTIGGILITDQIMGRQNSWEELYNPSRISFSSTREFMKENANVAAQYVEWLSPKFALDLHSLPLGEGVVFRQGMKMLAVYKDGNEKLESHSAACPHLGGIVHWNNVEKSWDCPCHGSRFDTNGKVIEGPAWSDLEKADSPEVPGEAEESISQDRKNVPFYAPSESSQTNIF